VNSRATWKRPFRKKPAARWGVLPGLTTVRYAGSGDVGRFVLHPGNVNGDETADGADIADLLPCVSMNGDCIFLCDVDRNGFCRPEDVLRLVDLLNGGGSFEPWFGTPLPEDGNCP